MVRNWFTRMWKWGQVAGSAGCVPKVETPESWWVQSSLSQGLGTRRADDAIAMQRAPSLKPERTSSTLKIGTKQKKIKQSWQASSRWWDERHFLSVWFCHPVCPIEAFNGPNEAHLYLGERSVLLACGLNLSLIWDTATNTQNTAGPNIWAPRWSHQGGTQKVMVSDHKPAEIQVEPLWIKWTLSSPSWKVLCFCELTVNQGGRQRKEWRHGEYGGMPQVVLGCFTEDPVVK